MKVAELINEGYGAVMLNRLQRALDIAWVKYKTLLLRLGSKSSGDQVNDYLSRENAQLDELLEKLQRLDYLMKVPAREASLEALKLLDEVEVLAKEVRILGPKEHSVHSHLRKKLNDKIAKETK